MRLSEGFIVKQMGKKYVAVAVGERSKSFHGIVQLNPSGKMLWDFLEQGMNQEEMSEKMAERYEINRETAKNDIRDFLDKLEHAGILLR